MKKYLLLILLVGLFVVLPLLGSRFIPTHDGEYHIIRFANFYTMLSYGYLFPRWAPDFNSGFGIPLFNFHYPLPNYVGSFFHTLGSSFVDSVKLTLAAGYLAAAVASFFWLRTLFGVKQAALGALAAMLVPYWFVDIYVRGSVGEVLAIPFVFIALWATEKKIGWALGLATALLIIAHNIMSMLFVPFVLVYLLFRWRRGIISWTLGILTAAYFWLPAIAERGYMVGLNSVSYADHFPQLAQLLIPSWGTGFSGPGFAPDEMSFQIGVLPLLVFLFARPKTPLAKLFFFVGATAIFLMLPLSQPFWSTFTPLQLLQYPWRLLSFVIPVTALLAAYLAQTRLKLMVALVIVGSIAAWSYIRPVTYERRDDAHYLSRRNFTDGTSSLGNSFSTIWTPWKAERPVARVEITQGDGIIRMDDEKPLAYAFHVSSAGVARVRVNVLYYPGWAVWVDGHKGDIQESDGVAEVSVPGGEHDVSVRFGETPIRRAADIASLAGLLCLIGWAILKSNAYRDRHDATHKRARRPGHRSVHAASS
jgi:hypothetical protein